MHAKTYKLYSSLLFSSVLSIKGMPLEDLEELFYIFAIVYMSLKLFFSVLYGCCHFPLKVVQLMKDNE